jgi:hypothetical protein
MIDAIDELVARSEDCPELKGFHQAHRAHTEVLDFLVQEIRLRLDRGFGAFSYRSLWEYARWKIEMNKGPDDTFLMNDHVLPFYARAITILHPEFNGCAEFRKCKADLVFGTEVEPVPEKRPKNYARRLQWADGTALEHGWQPTIQHVLGPVARKQDIHRRPMTSVRPDTVDERRGKRSG